jgi:hypothetical protein
LVQIQTRQKKPEREKRKERIPVEILECFQVKKEHSAARVWYAISFTTTLHFQLRP